MSARIDCECGALTGLFFNTVTIERSSGGEHLTEVHVPAGHMPRRCLRFVAGVGASDAVLDAFVWNSSATRPDKQARSDVSTGGRPRGVAAGRAAEAIERYAALPDNP